MTKSVVALDVSNSTKDKIALFFLKTSVPRILAEQNIEEDNNERFKRESTKTQS